jgi:hypothetical protein
MVSVQVTPRDTIIFMPVESSESALGILYRPTDAPLIDSIDRAIQRDNQFTAALVRQRVHLFDVDLSLVFFKSEKLAYATLASPTTGGATGQRKARFYDCVALDIETSQLRQQVPSSLHEEFDKLNFESVRRPSAALWNAMWDAVKRIRPDILAELERLQKRREQKRFDFEVAGSTVYFQARDAIGTALEAANIGRRGVFANFSTLMQPSETVAPSVTRLSQGLAGGLTEDVVIHHDARRVPGFLRAEDVGDGFRFQRGRHVLDVVIGNRRQLETATGADLLYFNHHYGAFTLVQYKMMEQTGQGWGFRLDNQAADEVNRMVQYRTAFRQAGTARSGSDLFRLCDDPFFFKLVKRDRLEMDSDELTRGMYLNLTHYESLTASPNGPRGGTSVSFESARRWLCKTSFTDLLRDGWIGSRCVTEDQLLAWVSRGLDEGRVLVSAQSDTIPDSTESEDEPERDDF